MTQTPPQPCHKCGATSLYIDAGFGVATCGSLACIPRLKKSRHPKHPSHSVPPAPSNTQAPESILVSELDASMGVWARCGSDVSGTAYDDGSESVEQDPQVRLESGTPASRSAPAAAPLAPAATAKEEKVPRTPEEAPPPAAPSQALILAPSTTPEAPVQAPPRVPPGYVALADMQTEHAKGTMGSSGTGGHPPTDKPTASTASAAKTTMRCYTNVTQMTHELTELASAHISPDARFAVFLDASGNEMSTHTVPATSTVRVTTDAGSHGTSTYSGTLLRGGADATTTGDDAQAPFVIYNSETGVLTSVTPARSSSVCAETPLTQQVTPLNAHATLHGPARARLTYLLPPVPWDVSYGVNVRFGTPAAGTATGVVVATSGRTATLHLTTIVSVRSLPVQVVPYTMTVDALHFVMSAVDGVEEEWPTNAAPQPASVPSSMARSKSHQHSRSLRATPPQAELIPDSAAAAVEDDDNGDEVTDTASEAHTGMQLPTLHAVDLVPHASLRLAARAVSFRCEVLGVVRSEVGLGTNTKLGPHSKASVPEAIYIPHAVARTHLRDLLPGTARVTFGEAPNTEEKADRAPFLPSILARGNSTTPAIIQLGNVHGMRVFEEIVPVEQVSDPDMHPHPHQHPHSHSHPHPHSHPQRAAESSSATDDTGSQTWTPVDAPRDTGNDSHTDRDAGDGEEAGDDTSPAHHPATEGKHPHDQRSVIRVRIRVENPTNRTDLQLEVWKTCRETGTAQLIDYRGPGIVMPRNDPLDEITGSATTVRIPVPLTRAPGNDFNLEYTMLRHLNLDV